MRVVVLHPYTKFEVRRPCHSEDMAHDVCQHLTLKLVCESHQWWGTFIHNLSTLGLRFLELFAMYATDGRTDGRTDKSNVSCPLSYGRGIITKRIYFARQTGLSVLATCSYNNFALLILLLINERFLKDLKQELNNNANENWEIIKYSPK